MTDDLVERLSRAQSTPYGKARSALLEDVVRRADAAGDQELAFFARLALVTAYVMGGEPRKSLVPFARCVADWDADPAKYQQHSHTFFWCFKYAPSTLTKFPEVPLDQTYGVLDDMERRWRVGGYSLHAVHQHRWLVAAHVGDTDAAAEHFRLWSTSPRDELSDCIGCDPTQKVQHLTATGRTAEAVAQAVGVLDGQLTCNEQPQQMLTALLPAYVAEGMYAEAVDAHRRAYRILRNQPGELSAYADHIRFCARTGNLPRAVELVERHLPELDESPSPLATMEFTVAASYALSRVDLLVRRPQSSEDVRSGQLAEELAQQALELAEQFDRRNGTTHQSDEVRKALAAEPWVEYLPLSETARRAHARAQVQPQPAPVMPLPEGSGRAWLDRAEEAWQTDRRTEAIAAWQAFEQEVPESDRTPFDRARLLDGRGLAAMEDPEVALESWREALTLYAELGEEIRVLRDRGRIGRVLCEQGHLEEGLATGEEPLRRLIQEDEPRRRGGWQYSLATILAQAGRAEESLKELTELRSRPDTDRDLQSGAGILQCNLLLSLERLEEAEEAATAGTATAELLPRSFAYRQRGWIRLALQRPAEAVGDLEEAIALAVGTPDAEVHIAMCRLELAKAYLFTGRALEAAETAEEALPVLRDPELANLLVETRGVLTDAYRALGELESALAQVRALLTEAPDDENPHWLGLTKRDEGTLLERLDRDKEAIDVFLAAAEYFETAEQPLEYVSALRLAGQSARYAGEFGLIPGLLDRARAVLDALPSADEAVIFQSAGLHWDRAMLALQQGEIESAVAETTQAAEYYERGGFEDQLLNARLLLAEHSTTDETALAAIFASLPTGHPQYHRTGYLLADRLRILNRPQEAEALEARLAAS
ncbi:hypothetical protein Kfla_6006 [Kribbella flavida DSM 17836]|uniref:Tetratricopeptide repeat protein n=1 Tax=Kribbella flavida (strain DSM 17836 / JCM 10339 / NBRC 14399) TaxID=479435 RepID=D2PSV7_KRIFD|nr:hypothetical protein [Kribbella flavida]ADB35009.1 hypothetical protein Kfla_6006 [Kribbella flavida DSM 17836]